MHLSISNDIPSTKIYDKLDDLGFELVNFPFLCGDVPCSSSFGVIFISLFDLLDHLFMLLTLTFTISC